MVTMYSKILSDNLSDNIRDYLRQGKLTAGIFVENMGNGIFSNKNMGIWDILNCLIMVREYFEICWPQWLEMHLTDYFTNNKTTKMQIILENY